MSATKPVQTENAIVDTSYHPLIHIQLRHSPTLDEFEQIAGYFEQMLAEQQQTAMVVDFRETNRFKVVETAKYWVVWLAKHRRIIEPVSIGVAGLSENKFVTGVINSMIRVSPVSTPLRMFRNSQRGIDWLFEQAGQSQVELSDRAALNHL